VFSSESIDEAHGLLMILFLLVDLMTSFVITRKFVYF